MVKQISELSEIPQNGKVILDFFTEWCGPCKKIAPMFQSLSEQYDNITFLKANAEEAEEVAAKYNIVCFPTFVFIKDGEEVSRISTSKTESLTEKISNF